MLTPAAARLLLTGVYERGRLSAGARRWGSRRQFKPKVAPTRQKKTPSMLAIEHFDFYYAPVFGKHWPSIRLGLLMPNKFVAVLNRLSRNVDSNRAILGGMPIVDIVQQLTRGRQLAVERLAQNAAASAIASLSATDAAAESLLSGLDDDDGNEAEQREESSRSLDGLEEFRQSTGEFTFGKVQMAQTDVASARPKHINVTGYEHIGQQIDCLDDVIFYPRDLGLFAFQRDDVADFPAPIKDASGISSWWLLDGGSIVPVLALGVQSGDVVLDMCAAPGGKSLLITQCGQFEKLICNDAKLSRLGQLRRALSMYIPVDSEYNEKLLLKRKDAANIETWDELQIYDKVLLDAPCSTDRLSVNQDDFNLFAIGETQQRLKLPQTQTKMLINALRSVKVGGIVVYSTCTLSPMQNECVVENAVSLVREHYNMEVVEKSVNRLKNHLKNTTLFRFSDTCRRGTLVVPNLRSNFGPMYICKLMRTR